MYTPVWYRSSLQATWSTPGFRDYHRRMQLFILLFIEGGSYVHEDEDAWEFYVLYERRKRRDSDLFTYHFVGYTSVYPFWCYPEMVRLRLRCVLGHSTLQPQLNETVNL